MNFITSVFYEAWQILLDSSIYILLGIIVAGLLKIVLSPQVVLRHLGKGRYSSVFKAAFFGVPLPL